jgi:glycosyltransferase involved in cell wall biosynthesis
VGDTGKTSPPTHQAGPLVSIITPTFNSARFLRQTLESVARQTYRPIEHIVVDGGSEDDTLRIAGEFPHVRVISEPDNGMYDAINKGLRTAGGSILAYLNGDDLYFPDTVGRVVKEFETEPEAGLVFGYCMYIDPEGEELFVRRYPPYNWTLYSILDGSTIPQQATFWRRRVMETVGYFDASFRMAGDFEFFIRSGKRWNVRKIGGAPLAQFRFHSGMQTISGKALNDAEVKLIHDRHPVSPAWATPFLRLIATVRYRIVNYRRLGDKIRDRLSGKEVVYRP